MLRRHHSARHGALHPVDSDEDKTRYLSDRGLEILQFIDQFMQECNLPPLSDDGKTGGIAILGWSMGATFALSAIANADRLEAPARERISQNLRALIMDGMRIPPPSMVWI